MTTPPVPPLYTEMPSDMSDATYSENPPPINLLKKSKDGTVCVNYDELLDRLLRPRTNSFQCQIEGVLFDIKISPTQSGSTLCAVAEIGAMPFTAESSLKRQMLRTILDTLPKQKDLYFSLTEQGVIVLTCNVDLYGDNSPEVNFARLIQKMQYILPYIRLIGTYL